MTTNIGRVRLSIAIFCHSKRLPYARELYRTLKSQGAVDVRVIINDEGCWPSARLAWKAMEPGATHHLVIADDAGPCRNFVRGVCVTIEAKPDEEICYFDPKQINQKAVDKGHHWICLNKAYGLVNSMPSEMVSPFLRWERANFKEECPHDDSRISAYLMREGRYSWHTVPSLCEHLLPYDSVVGNHPPIKRTAWVYDKDLDAAAVDWDKGKDDPIIEPRFNWREVYRKEMRGW